MHNMPSINLPDYFTAILKSNMQVSGQNFGRLYTYIHSTPPLLAIVKKVFKDFGFNTEISKIVKSLGWIGFRNRMANAFLHFEKDGFFSEELDSGLVADLVNLEEDFKPFEVSGYSRGFLLGFYIKMSEINSIKNKRDYNYFDLSYIPLLTFSNSRISNVDWVYIMILHFSQFLGEETLKEVLKKGLGFNHIYSHLKDDQKELFAGNLLSYGHAIGEPDIFYPSRV